LAVIDGKGYQKMTHVEAENRGFIRGKEYGEIFWYIADSEAIKYLSSLREVLQSRPTAYQVTKK